MTVKALMIGHDFVKLSSLVKGNPHSIFYEHPASCIAHSAMEVPMSEQVTIDTLKGFLEAFNRHDLNAIMGYFAEDCVFYMPRGAQPRGARFVGKQEVRAGLAKRFEGIPDVHYGDDQHWLCGDFGVSEWTLTGTTVSGQRIEVRGVDLLEFAQGKILRKDSFWKIVE
jgi:ketosteroid isomerase-like protein